MRIGTKGRHRIASVQVRRWAMPAIGGRFHRQSRAMRPPSRAAGTPPSTCTRSRARRRATTRSVRCSCRANRARRSARRAPATARSRCARASSRARAPGAKPRRRRVHGGAAGAAATGRARGGARARHVAGALAGRSSAARCSSTCRTTSRPATSACARRGYRSIERQALHHGGHGHRPGQDGERQCLGIVAETTGQAIAAIGVTTFRPPYTPVTFGAVVGRNCGAMFDPVRRTPMHAGTRRRARCSRTSGKWKRPWYYPAGRGHGRGGRARGQGGAQPASASWTPRRSARSTSRARMPRSCSTASTPTPGASCRSAAPLRADARRGRHGVRRRRDHAPCRAPLPHEHHLGGAARVLAWLEEWLQTEWRSSRSTAPRSPSSGRRSPSRGRTAAAARRAGRGHRRGAGGVPAHEHARGAVRGVPARVFRISFTGELGFEIQVPASYGLAVWEACIEAGAKYGITPTAPRRCTCCAPRRATSSPARTPTAR